MKSACQRDICAPPIYCSAIHGIPDEEQTSVIININNKVSKVYKRYKENVYAFSSVTKENEILSFASIWLGLRR